MRIKKATVVGGTALALALGGGGVALAVGPGSGPGPGPGAGPVAVTASVYGTADAQLAADLAMTREEERMAGDLYELFAQQYPDQVVFSRIAASEDRHFAAAGNLLTGFGLGDPSADLPAGQYADPTLQQLYDQWKAQGLESEQAALQVGIDLETRDISDLQAMIARTEDSRVDTVLQRLLNGSQQHLAAFTAAANGTQPTLGPAAGTGWTGQGAHQRLQDCPLAG